MPEHGPSQAHEQVVTVAGRLFRERGYTAVTMRDIADELGMRQASLYYHAPEGKEQLFVEVTEQGLARHQQELDRIIAEAEPNIAVQFRTIASWLLAQPPLDITRFFRVELLALSEAHRSQLAERARWAWFGPIEEVITAAYERGEIRFVEQKMMSVSFVSNMEAVHDLHQYTAIPKEVLARDIIEVLLDGLRRR